MSSGPTRCDRPIEWRFEVPDNRDFAERRWSVYSVLLGVYVALAVTATAGACKIVGLPAGAGASVTVFVFLMSLVVLNLINEFFDKRRADLAVNIAVGSNIIAVVIFALCAAVPSSSLWQGPDGLDPQVAYSFVLGTTFRFFIAGQTAAYIAGRVNNLLVNRAKGKSFVVRHTIPLLIAELLDTAIFVPIAFYGSAPVPNVIVGQYIVKVTFMLLCCQPVLYGAMLVMRRHRVVASLRGPRR